MYGNMKKIQEEVDKIQVTAFSKNNEVSVTVTGKHRLADIKITDKKWISLKKLIKKENIKKRDCILLPFKTLKKIVSS